MTILLIDILVIILIAKIIEFIGFFFFRFYLFLDRGERSEKEREGETHQCLAASCVPRTGEPGLISQGVGGHVARRDALGAVSYTHLTLPTNNPWCRSRWSPYH